MSALCVSAFLLSSPLTTAQVVTDGEGDVMIGGTVSDPSGIFELISTTKGFLLPRMTEVQRDAVVSPASALMIFNTDSGEFQYWDADTGQWEIFVTSVNLSDFGWLITGNEELTTWDGSSGNFLGTTGDNALVLLTQEEQEIQFWTNNMQRALFSSDGNFLPATDNTYSLGTDTNRWSEVFVAGGSVHIGPTGGESGDTELRLGYAADAATISVNATTAIDLTTATTSVNNALTVTGNVDAMNGLDVTSGDLTVGGDTNFIVDAATGNTDIAGTLAVVGATTLIRNVDAQAGLDVTGGALTVGGDTNFIVDAATGNTDIAGTLVVDDSVTFRGNVDAMNGLDVTSGDLTVGGTNFTVDAATGTLAVVGATTLSGNVDAQAGLDVTGGDLTVGGTSFTVDAATGNTDIAGTLVVDDSVTFRGNVDAQAGLDVTGNTDIDGATTLGSGDAGDEVTVNTAGGTDLVISEDGVDRSSSTVQTFDIDNSGTSHVNVLINGATSTTNSRLTVNNGHWTSQQTNAPTITGATGKTTAQAITNATDVAGMISFTTDNPAGSADQVSVTFNSAYSTAPIVVLTAANGDAGGSDVYVTSTATAFTVNFDSVPSNDTEYEYYYQVIETE